MATETIETITAYFFLAAAIMLFLAGIMGLWHTRQMYKTTQMFQTWIKAQAEWHDELARTFKEGNGNETGSVSDGLHDGTRDRPRQ